MVEEEKPSWGILQPATENIREAHKKKRDEDDKKKFAKAEENVKANESAIAKANEDRRKAVEKEKKGLLSKAVSRGSVVVPAMDVTKGVTEPGDLEIVLNHIKAHPGVQYVEMISLWNEELGLVIRMSNDRLDVALKWLKEKEIIIKMPDINLPPGYWGFYTAEDYIKLCHSDELKQGYEPKEVQNGTKAP